VLLIDRELDLTRRVQTNGKDEITQLGSSINLMLDIIEHSQKEKDLARDELKKALEETESRVQARTLELAVKNEELKREIFTRQQAENELSCLLQKDHLTGAASRAEFETQIEKAFSQADRMGKQAALMLMDIDRFKEINDTLGHPVGDKLLISITKRIEGCLRREDTVARWGGDEFAVLVVELSQAADAGAVASKIINALEIPFTINGEEIHISASVGIAVYPQDGSTYEAILKQADIAMYRAKAEGGATACFYKPEMDTELYQRLSIENMLRHAMENNELTLHYQPQLNLKNGAITGMEALIRWNNKNLGEITPEKFIPIAERTGLIIPIGNWVLETAVKQAKEFRDKFNVKLKMAVNISPRQFKQPDLVERIKNLLDEYKLEPELLNIEITEGLLVDSSDKNMKILKDLNNLGITISIDDFGTGYSSLSYLKDFPIDCLKIDKSFITGISEKSSNLSIIKTIIGLGKNMKMDIIAEGTELLEHIDVLKKHDCDFAQGFCICKPLNAQEVSLYLERHFKK
jgi:diguanylate cyclase (GGDEF)-like protein